MKAKATAAKLRRFQDAATSARVTAAMPIARELALGGLEELRAGPTAHQVDVLGYVEELIGYDPNTGFPDDAKWEQRHLTSILAAFEATFTIGLAVGLLLRPEAFAKGGAR